MAHILAKHKIERFLWYRYNELHPDRKLFDLEQFKKHPERIQIAFHETKNEQLRESNPFFLQTPSYGAAKDLAHFMTYLEEQMPENRICATMVLEGLPCSAYFDLERDYKSDPFAPDYAKRVIVDRKEKEDIMNAHWDFYRLAFEAEFKQSPRLLSWEFDASTTEKFSFHAHLPEEKFTTVEDQRRLMHNRYFPIVQDAARKGDPRALLLGHWTKTEPKVCSGLFPVNPDTGMYWSSIVDPGVYTMNRIFRLPGNRKPNKQPLDLFRWPVGKENSYENQLRAAIITCQPVPGMWSVAEVIKEQSVGQKKMPPQPHPMNYERIYRTLPGHQQLPVTLEHKTKLMEVLPEGFGLELIKLERSAYYLRGYLSYKACPIAHFHAKHPCRTCVDKQRPFLKVPPCHHTHNLLEPSEERRLRLYCSYRGDKTECVLVCIKSSRLEKDTIRIGLKPDLFEFLFHGHSCNPTTMEPDEWQNVFYIE